MSRFLELETRRKIYNLIMKNPGLHFSKISEMLNMRMSLVEYHLAYLEKEEVIISAKEEGYKRYYIKDSVRIQDRKILSLLRQEIPLGIVLFLLQHPCSKHKDILKEFDLAPSTLSYHLKKLQKHGVIAEQTTSEKNGYIVANEKEIIGILLQYKPFDVFESFKGIWAGLHIE